MYKLQRRLSQNFLRDRQLVDQLVRNSSIGPHDTVIEIGPGKGIITRALVKKAKMVLAVEIDSHLISPLVSISQTDSLILFNQNFLDFSLPHTPYKIFANPPFAIEGQIIRKLLDAPNPPEEIYLVLRKEHALRWSGYQPSMFAMKYGPWFTFKIVHQFKGTDFSPPTKVKAVLLHMSKRKQPLVTWADKDRYQNVIEAGFTGKIKLKKRPTTYTLNDWVKMDRQLLVDAPTG